MLLYFWNRYNEIVTHFIPKGKRGKSILLYPKNMFYLSGGTGEKKERTFALSLLKFYFSLGFEIR